MGRNFFYTAILSVLLIVSAKPALAVATPTFPECSNPQGTLKAHYDNGIHGIPGSTNEYQGSDSVYSLDDLTLLQCFCDDYGQGIQTNWWKIPGFSQEDIDMLKRQSWTYIPNGELWGLDNAPYMAISKEYICGGTGGGSVLGASTIGSVPGLAATGNILSIYALIGLGTGLMIARLLLQKLDK